MSYQYTIPPPYHGESKSLWYIVRWQPENPEDWEVVASYTNHETASRELKRLEGKS